MDSQKGISLVALVVTIIVLLIIIGISVALTLGPDSVVKKSHDGKIDNRYGLVSDRVKMRETELAIAASKNETGSSPEEFIRSLIDDGVINLDEDSYSEDYSVIYIGLQDDNKYKYEIHVKENDIEVEEDNITFIFVLGGGNIGGSTLNKTIVGESGSTVILPDNPLRENYVFSGWSPSVPTIFEENKTFIAQWTPLYYTFIFNLNGGNIGGSESNQLKSGSYGDSFIPPSSPVKSNYIFKGWSPALPSTINGDKTFIAQWEAVQYTFTFDLNGGKISGIPGERKTSGAYGSTVIIPPNPTKINSNFIGWTPSVPATIDGNKTFVAQWEQSAYIITYNLNGGNVGGSTANQTRLVEKNNIPPSIAVSRTDYELIGWTPDLAPATKDITYTAIWAMPMKIQMIRINVNHKISIPLKLSSSSFVLISFDGQPYEEYTSDRPTFETDIPINTPIDVKIAGRVEAFTYNYKNITMVPQKQLYKILDWGELGASQYMFANTGGDGCENLLGPIPALRPNTFVNVVNLEYLFYGCSKLTGNIPEYLFNNCQNVTEFSYAFCYCENLTGTIPENFFNRFPLITDFTFIFAHCKKLTGSISANLFVNFPNATSMSGVFYNCSGLTGSIPGKLFEKNTQVIDFSYTFYYCTGLTSIPANLFNTCLNVTNFSYTFAYCTNLLNAAPELWNRTNVNTTAYCFRSCTKLTNYDDIPAEWK